MSKSKYKYNPETLSFEVETVTFFSKIKRVLTKFVTGSAIAATWIFVYSLFFNTPKESRLVEQNNKLLSSYDLVDYKLSAISNTLTELEYRDNKIYRSVFEEDSIPSSIREAGMGGANRYLHFENVGIANPDVLISANMNIDKLMKKAYIQSKSFDEVSLLAKDKVKMHQSMPIGNPIDLTKVRLSSHFGGRMHPIYHVYKVHHGIDLSGAIGTDIYSSGDGVITRSEFASGYGNLVEVNHGYGYSTRYAHLSAMYVHVGQRVKRGERIAALGNTGGSVGPHLHYEVRIKGESTNPLNYFENNFDSESEDVKELLLPSFYE